jgi:hypothetical protein
MAMNYRRGATDLALETELEAMSSLGIQTYVGSKSLARFCCESLNLQRLAESAFSKLDRANEAQTRQVLPQCGDVSNTSQSRRFPLNQTRISPGAELSGERSHHGHRFAPGL